ncbi:MAG: hypothetical protein JNL11_10615 [Bdellovibrionaceae bacterium]|nr:hypothetical protein [Pseudobdellovibrionaceae bacterium]
MKSFIFKYVISIVFILTHTPTVQASEFLNRQEVQKSEDDRVKLLSAISILEEKSKLTYFDRSGHAITYSEMFRNPKAFKEHSIVTGKIDEVYSGFRMRIDAKVTDQILAVTVLDQNDLQILGRASISLVPNQFSDSSAVRKITMDNVILHLAAQMEASLIAQKKIAKNENHSKSFFAFLFSSIVPSANAENGRGIGSVFTMWLTVILGTSAVLGAFYLLMGFLVTNSKASGVTKFVVGVVSAAAFISFMGCLSGVDC